MDLLLYSSVLLLYSSVLRECEADLAAVTETWLCCYDDTVRAEGSCTRLSSRRWYSSIFQGLADGQKVGGGATMSYEFLEWTVQLASSHDFG